MSSITILTGSRLHFGLLVRGEPRRRVFGGIGLMIDQPGYSLSVHRSDETRLEARPETRSRIEHLLRELRPDSCWRIDVAEEIPAHAGLGSGTQLGLALAAAIHRLQGEPVSLPTELARKAGRGKRSLVGTIGFETGGLIVHGLTTPLTARVATSCQLVRSDVVRQEFPAAWRFVLATPSNIAGLSGAAESAAFRDLPPMNAAQLAQLETLAQQITHAIHACGFAATSAALHDYGHLVGEYFARIQGGIFADSRMASLAEKLSRDGVRGVGQTSWGPTLFALCDSDAMAEAVAAEIRRSAGSDCAVRIVSAKNSGAEIIESK